MLAIARACANGDLNAQIAIVISNKVDAKGLTSAAEMGLNTAVVDHTAFENKLAFEKQLNAVLIDAQADWIALAGFMRILGADFVTQWSGKIVNIHPSLLPSYPGLNTHARAIEAGEDNAGATVHFVTPELDAGPIVAQRSVPIYPHDTAETLAERVVNVEHVLYVEALQQCLNVKAH